MNLKKYVLSFCYKVRTKLKNRYKKLENIDNGFWVYVSNNDLESDN